MNENFIIQYIPMRMAQLGFSKWHIRYHDFLVGPGNSLKIEAYGDLYYVVEAPQLSVYSDYGIYAPLPESSINIYDNKYEHRGEIFIYNNTPQMQRIKLIQVIMVS